MKLTYNKSSASLNKKQDLIHLVILLAIALLIGVYLIDTTVVITQDGAWYIEQARKFSGDPQNVIKRQDFGFPLLIFITYKLVTLFSGSSSLFTWIYSAQSVTLLCRLLSLISLYFIGKILVGRKSSFWAILILIILPYPAQFVSEVLREWPYILFFASGFLFLILGVKQGIWWLFAATGFVAGLGHTIRPECAQLIIYAALWIFIRLFFPKPEMTRPRLFCALSVLIIGFAIPTAPYMTARGQFLPAKLKALLSSAGPEDSKDIQEPEINSDKYIYPVRYAKTLSHGVNIASSMPGKMAKAIGELVGAIGENLMYYFLPALLIGIYVRFSRGSSQTSYRGRPALESRAGCPRHIEMFFMPAFAALNIVMLIALYYSWGYISRRHCLPLVVFTIFYVPVGLQVLADWFANRFSKSKPASGKDCQRWFFILLTTGIVVCLPKLLSRPGSDKPGFRAAAAWLKQNTSEDDLIAVPDRRITFYAERKELIYETTPPGKADYVVAIVKDENELPDHISNAQKQYSVWENERTKNKKIVIYKMT